MDCGLLQFCAILLKTKIIFLPSEVPWGAYHIHRNFPFHKWFFTVEKVFYYYYFFFMFFTLRKNGSFKNVSQRGSLANQKIILRKSPGVLNTIWTLALSCDLQCHVAVMASLDSNVPIGCVLENLSWSSTSWLFLAYCFILYILHIWQHKHNGKMCPTYIFCKTTKTYLYTYTSLQFPAEMNISGNKTSTTFFFLFFYSLSHEFWIQGQIINNKDLLCAFFAQYCYDLKMLLA